MIYTLGRASTYEPEMQDREAKGERLLKVGRCAETPGGAVWETYAAAEKYLKTRQSKGRLEGYAIYGVEADWERDTEPAVDFGRALPWHNLLIDAPIARVRRPDPAPTPQVRRSRKRAEVGP